MFCPECGSKSVTGAKFCSSCGASLGAVGSPKIQAKSKPTPKNDLRVLFITSSQQAASIRKLLTELGFAESDLVFGDTQQEIQSATRRVMDRYDSLCILGGWSEVPPVMVPNPLDWRDGETWCLSDTPFGLREEPIEDDLSTFMDGLPVSRIPTVSSGIVKRLLSTSRFSGDPTAQFRFAVSAECWEEATSEILERIQKSGAPLYCSPDCGENRLGSLMNSATKESGSLFLFNVHGGADTPEWRGESNSAPEYPVIFRPQLIEDFNGAFVLSEACYGGAMEYEEPSIVESFFESGGLGFVGCSVIAYGTPDASLSGADHIAHYVLENIAAGQPLGAALHNAKKQLLENFNDGEDDSQVLAKTILSFNAYGAPWICYSAQSPSAPPSPPLASRPTSADRLSDIRNRLSQRIENRRETLSSRLSGVRQGYRSRLPLRAQRFLLDKEEALAQIRKFKDLDRIKSFLSSKGLQPTDCQLERRSTDEIAGFRLSGETTMRAKQSKEQFLILLNSDGEIQKTILTKGF